MKVIKDKEENRQAYLTIEMEAADMEDGMKHAYEHLVQRANIPGFRKGKAPRAVVERTLGKGRMLEEAIDHLIPEAYEKALTEQQIEPYAQPEVHITKAEPLVFTAVVPLMPAVTLGDYKGIRMTAPVAEIKDENVSGVLEELRHQHATWEPADRPLALDDMATLDIHGQVGEEKPFIQKIGAQYRVAKDAVTPAPGFAEQVAGLNKDETKEFDITYPADFPSTALAGKTGHFKVKLHEVKQEKLPALEDLPALVSAEYKTLDALKEEVVKSLKFRAEEQARMDLEEKTIDAAVEQSQIDYPPVIIDLEINRLINNQARQVQQVTGQGMEDYLRSVNKTVAQLQEELRPVAVKNVRASLVLSKIAQEENIDVSEEEIRNGIGNMVRGLDESKKDDMIKLLDTPQNRQSMTLSLKTRKVIERLTDIAGGAADKKETAENTGAAAGEENKEEAK